MGVGIEWKAVVVVWGGVGVYVYVRPSMRISVG